MYYFTDVPKVKLKIPAKNELMTIGNAMVLEAQIESFPLPTKIIWKKDENIIHPDRRNIFVDKSDAQRLKLIIKNAQYSDNGNYSITVINIMGSGRDDKRIKLRGMLNFMTFFKPENLLFNVL